MSSGQRLNKPIIVLGFHRSGTTLLGRIFSRHPDLAYWTEPRHVWMHAFPYRRFDRLSESDARPRVVANIHREFLDFQHDAGKPRFAEKTPSNMVRLPFIRKAMPDCKVIHIIRDGRACTFSTVDILQRPQSGNAVRSRMKQVPWWHYPSYIPKVWRNMIMPRLTGKSIAYWGPRIPGLRPRVRRMPQDEVCAWQWQETLNIARRDARAFAPEQYREWHYEDLVSEPVRVIGEMFAFAELSFPDELREYLQEHVHAKSLNKWREKFSDDEINRITPHLEPLLSELGYSTDNADERGA